jgi:hypothetical protein
MAALATLDRTERWMQSVITHPLGVDRGVAHPSARNSIDVAPAEIDSIVCRSRRLTATERLGIYHHAYFARLVECLEGDFPVFRQAVGDDAFRQFALEYIAQQPSCSYTLGRLGDGFVDFLREDCPKTDSRDSSAAHWSEFLIELARFERVVAEVFDGPGIEAQPGLNVERLRMSEARLVPAPCLRLIRLQFAVHDWFEQRGQIAQSHALERRDICLVLMRRNYRVVWHEVEPGEFRLLQRLAEGATLAEVLISEATNSAMDVDALASKLRQLFCRWATLRLFVDVGGGPIGRFHRRVPDDSARASSANGLTVRPGK